MMTRKYMTLDDRGAIKIWVAAKHIDISKYIFYTLEFSWSSLFHISVSITGKKSHFPFKQICNITKNKCHTPELLYIGL